MRMPIYEYKCQKCGIIEITQRITDKSLGKCPTCKGKVKKLISHTSFQLKGTGWYLTDYARKDKGSQDKVPKAEAKGDGKATESSAASGKASSEKREAKTPASDF